MFVLHTVASQSCIFLVLPLVGKVETTPKISRTSNSAGAQGQGEYLSSSSNKLKVRLPGWENPPDTSISSWTHHVARCFPSLGNLQVKSFALDSYTSPLVGKSNYLHFHTPIAFQFQSKPQIIWNEVGNACF